LSTVHVLSKIKEDFPVIGKLNDYLIEVADNHEAYLTKRFNSL